MGSTSELGITCMRCTTVRSECECFPAVSPPGLNHEVPTTLKHQSGVLTNSRRSMRKRSPILRKSMQKSPPTFKFTSRLSDCCSKRDKGDRM